MINNSGWWGVSPTAEEGAIMEEKKIDRLYELLSKIKSENKDENNEMIASLTWAIFELESIYCREE